jgi:hypothetical protein
MANNRTAIHVIQSRNHRCYCCCNKAIIHPSQLLFLLLQQLLLLWWWCALRSHSHPDLPDGAILAKQLIHLQEKQGRTKRDRFILKA